ncbi:TPA: cupin domain-containing protein [Streptococcus pyogenes]
MIENLSQLVQYHDHQVASRSLSRLLGLSQSIVLYAMAQGESISQETSPRDKVILVLEGQLIFDLEDQKQVLTQESFIAIPAQKVHHLEAKTDCKLLQVLLD